MPKLQYAERFVSEAEQIWSPKLMERLKRVLAMLETFPESGSPMVRPSLLEEFGPNIRTCSVSPFILVYEYDAEQDAVMLYGLIPQKTVR